MCNVDYLILKHGFDMQGPSPWTEQLISTLYVVLLVHEDRRWDDGAVTEDCTREQSLRVWIPSLVLQ